MFVKLDGFQKGTFLITIRLWEGPPALSGEFFEALFAALMQVFCRGWIGWKPDFTDSLAWSAISG